MNTTHHDPIKLISSDLLRDDYPNALYAFDNILLLLLCRKAGLSLAKIKGRPFPPEMIRQILPQAQDFYRVPTFYEYIFENRAGWDTEKQRAREQSALQEIKARPETIALLDACVHTLNTSGDVEEVAKAYAQAVSLCKPKDDDPLLDQQASADAKTESHASRNDPPPSGTTAFVLRPA